jgi:predicted membrane protein
MLQIEYVFALFTVAVALAVYIGDVQMRIRERISDVKQVLHQENRRRKPDSVYISKLEQDIRANELDANALILADVLLVISGLLLLLHLLIWFSRQVLASYRCSSNICILVAIDILTVLLFALAILYLIFLHFKQWGKYFEGRGRSTKNENQK